MGEAKNSFICLIKIIIVENFDIKRIKMAHAARNVKINGGIMRFSRSKMYHKKAAFVKTKAAVKKVAAAKAGTVTKEIGGEQNGEKRVVQLQNMPRSLPTPSRKQRKPSNKKPFSQHNRKLRSTITPGTVLILLA